MNAIIQPSGLSRGSTLSGPPSRKIVQLGRPGLDPAQACLDVLILDDSWSLRGDAGNDPVGNRYAEAQRAINALARRTVTGRQRVAVMHFDHPVLKPVGPLRLNLPHQRREILEALRQPSNAAGSSSLTPAMTAANKLARDSGIEVVRCTIFSDFELTDLNRQQPYDEIATFPGRVHAIALNAEPPAALLALANVTITRVEASSPPGMVAAALLHSLTATRRGASHARLGRPRPTLSPSYFSPRPRLER